MNSFGEYFLQQFCCCGAGIAAQLDERKTFDAWVEHHPRTCGEGFSDEKPFKVAHKCGDCGIYVYAASSGEAQALLNDHPCPVKKQQVES